MTIVRLDHACLIGANLKGVRAKETVFVGANLEHAILNEANLEGAKLSEARVYGVSTWDIEPHSYNVRAGMIISSNASPLPVRVYDLSVVQFIYSLYRRSPITKIINAATE